MARLTEVWADEHAHWLKRDLSARHYVYFWADGIHVQARLEDDAQCLLVIIGATREGKKELVGLIDMSSLWLSFMVWVPQSSRIRSWTRASLSTSRGRLPSRRALARSSNSFDIRT